MRIASRGKFFACLKLSRSGRRSTSDTIIVPPMMALTYTTAQNPATSTTVNIILSPLVLIHGV
ncbi:MAG: hypothetical protein WC460_03400 [Patescibacteria group bacterium]